MRWSNSFPVIGVVTAGAALIVAACTQDVRNPVAPTTNPPLSIVDAATTRVAQPVAEARVAKPRNLRRAPNTVHFDLEPNPAGQIYAVDFQVDGEQRVVEARIDPTGQFIEKVSYYADGERYYGADLQWSVDDQGPYISAISQSYFTSSEQQGAGNSMSYTRAQGWVENGRWEPMQTPLGSIASDFVMKSVAEHRASSPSLRVSFQSGTACTPQAVSGLYNIITIILNGRRGGSGTPPAPPSSMPAAFSCLKEMGIRTVETAWELEQPFYNAAITIGVSIAMKAVVKSQKIWDSLRRPFSAGGGTGDGGDVWLKTAGNCNATIGYACSSLTAYMQM